MADAKEICIGCVGIIIVLAIIGGVMNIFSDHMGWNDNSNDLKKTGASTPIETKKVTVSQTSASNADSLYESHFIESNTKIKQIMQNIESDINSEDLPTLRMDAKELNSICIYYTNKIDSLTVSSSYQNSKKNYLAMLDCFAAAGNYLMDGVDYYYGGENSHSERYFGFAADEFRYGTEYLGKAYY